VVRLRLEPLDAGSGIVFYREDQAKTIELKPENVVDTKMATVIGKDGVVISTIEHLMSAISASGIDNLRIVIDNDEVPIMEGSSAAFCMLLEEAGIKELDAAKKVLVVKKAVEVREGDKFVRLSPASECRYSYEIKFDHPLIQVQRYDFVFTRENFKNEIGRARTFGFLKEVQYLRSIGLAKGGSLENAIVLDDFKILNPEGLRFDDEFVRHKVLDAIGDMTLLGMPFIGHYEASAGSHKLNHLLTKKLLESAENYEIVELHIEKEGEKEVVLESVRS
ncbi:MAG: UDP-3-O-acyl-N-acetylglucosamine deacetylase, partial [Campylobacteraceae bacterium]|nr:UDP-3-O-acyl-N-acetylglucosamine deacetylase [Campylobacteraceae bacterium]